MIWVFTFFIMMCKNGRYFELCSIVNFNLGCRFCSRLCNSLISPQAFPVYETIVHLFYDLVNSSFVSLTYFLPIISYGFSPKYAKVRVVDVGYILLPKTLPRVWI